MNDTAILKNATHQNSTSEQIPLINTDSNDRADSAKASAPKTIRTT